MTLKTLKDFEGMIFCRDAHKLHEAIKQEAIKRAKHWSLRMKQMTDLGEMENYTYFKGMHDETVLSNNLTKEDLK